MSALPKRESWLHLVGFSFSPIELAQVKLVSHDYNYDYIKTKLFIYNWAYSVLAEVSVNKHKGTKPNLTTLLNLKSLNRIR